MILLEGVSSQPSHQHQSSVNEPAGTLFRPPCSSTPQILDFAAGVIQRISSYYLEDPASLSDQMSDTVLMQSTYVENTMTLENARDYGHAHLSKIISHANRFENKAILLIHFSARYRLDVITEALSALNPPLAGRVFALTEAF